MKAAAQNITEGRNWNNEAAFTKKNINENLTPKEINAACENGVKLQPFLFQKRDLK